MHRSKNVRPARNSVELSFFDALERLKSGAPNDPQLAKRAKRGILRISVAVVAQEAGHSRTLISHEGCAYPAVRRAILDAKAPPRSEPTSLAEINRRLRQENAELRRTVKLARDSMAAMALRMNRVVREAERRVAAADRRAGNRASSAEVAGQFCEERVTAATEKVVPIRRPNAKTDL